MKSSIVKLEIVILCRYQHLDHNYYRQQYQYLQHVADWFKTGGCSQNIHSYNLHKVMSSNPGQNSIFNSLDYCAFRYYLENLVNTDELTHLECTGCTSCTCACNFGKWEYASCNLNSRALHPLWCSLLKYSISDGNRNRYDWPDLPILALLPTLCTYLYGKTTVKDFSQGYSFVM